MPPNSDNVPLIAIYYFGSMLIISLATAGTVLSLNILKKGDLGEPVSRIVQIIFFEFFARLLFIKIKVTKELRVEMDDQTKRRLSVHDSAYFNLLKTFAPGIDSGPNNTATKGAETSKVVRSHNQRDVEASQRLEMEEHPTGKSNKSQSIMLRMPSNHVVSAKNSSRSKVQFNSKHVRDSEMTGGGGSGDEFSEGGLLLRPAEDERMSSEQRKLIKYMRHLNANLERMHAKEIVDDLKQDIKNQWKALAKVIDIIMLYSFLLSTCGMFFFLISQVPYTIVMN
jgi:hypothetical protein